MIWLKKSLCLEVMECFINVYWKDKLTFTLPVAGDDRQEIFYAFSLNIGLVFYQSSHLLQDKMEDISSSVLLVENKFYNVFCKFQSVLE